MPTPLRLGGVPEHFNLPFHVLQEAGSPVPFSWQDYPGGTGALCKALENNELDVASVLSEGIVAYNARVGQVVVPAFWVQTPLIWGIHTGAATPYTSVADLRGKPFAISRPGSGSQLMAYLLAQREGWPKESLSFVEVGHLAGATKALIHQEAAGFLWERFMTQPLVTDGSFSRLGEIPTPWPAFAFAVRPDVWATRQEEVLALIQAAQDQAQQLAESDHAPSLIASRYGLTKDQAAQWLQLTQWAERVSDDIDMQLADIEHTLRVVGVL